MKNIIFLVLLAILGGCASQAEMDEYVALTKKHENRIAELRASRTETMDLLKTLASQGKLNHQSGKKAVDKLFAIESEIENLYTEIDSLEERVSINEKAIKTNTDKIKENKDEIEELKKKNISKKLTVLSLMEENQKDRQSLFNEFLMQENTENSLIIK
ncbi:hypothetical protein [Vibrio parahaemolyticus]|uniref:hypothetical protein n=1 Tax=Vibrio parahaemolyticus TaxID=670 RepID=UPI00402BEAE5